MRFGLLPGALLSIAVLPFLPLNDNNKNSFTVVNLASDQPGKAAVVEDGLVNAWGVARSATGPWWVAAAETGLSKVFNGAGGAATLTVQVPGNPTGVVFNASEAFVITDGTTSGAAQFLFASEDGTISGWRSNIPPPPPSTMAFVAVDSSPAGAIYKGLAIYNVAGGDRLYATDFHNAHVDVFDGNFTPVTNAGAFVDPGIPTGFAPFGIQNLNGEIYVTYAMQDEDGEDDVAGPGLGYVSKFDTNGVFLARVASQGPLNAPWGLAIAPSGFGRFSGNLLVGNFGDGRINGYNLASFEHRGHLKLANHHPLEIEGLWGIGFGNDAAAGSSHALFFAAGPDDEEHGLFGKITMNE
jgi:uncharacterized protein (TIGR03118 family)